MIIKKDKFSTRMFLSSIFASFIIFVAIAQEIFFNMITVVIVIISFFVFKFTVKVFERDKINRKEREIIEETLVKNTDIVLYLRSFKIDKTMTTINVSPFKFQISNFIENDNALTTNEEAIQELLAPFGTFLALDNNIRNGFSRLVSTDSNWRDTIIKLIKKSNLVVLYMGESKSFLDEVSYTIELCDSDRIVFIIPLKNKKGKQSYEITSKRITEAIWEHKKIKINMPIHPNLKIQGKSFEKSAKLFYGKIYNNGFILFDKDWTPIVSDNLEILFRIHNKEMPKKDEFLRSKYFLKRISLMFISLLIFFFLRVFFESIKLLLGF